jgi:tetratricopeptide (TPR) repeat protein
MAIQRTKVRTELVEFLLGRGDNSQALSELLILSSDIPDTEPAHNEVGRLFLAAGDSQHALEQFTRTLRLNAKNVDALSGAGQATFNLQDYNRARRYLEAAVANGNNTPAVSTLMETTRLVLSRDPLASGIRTDERIRRLATDLEFASEELQSCLDKKQDDQSAVVVLEPLRTEVDQGMQSRFRPQMLRRDPDDFTTGLNLIRRMGLAVEQICGESSPLHTALLLIARKHGVGE